MSSYLRHLKHNSPIALIFDILLKISILNFDIYSICAPKVNYPRQIRITEQYFLHASVGLAVLRGHRALRPDGVRRRALGGRVRRHAAALAVRARQGRADAVRSATYQLHALPSHSSVGAEPS